jgi:chemotaxis signal transduction protein
LSDFIRFRTAEGVFMAPIERVIGVRRAADLQPLPGRRDDVAGLVDHEGEVLTVLSTLGKGGSHVLLLNSEGGRFGLLVTEVLGLASLAAEQLGPAPAGRAKELVGGVVKGRGGMELLLEVDGLWRELAKEG